MGHQDKEREGDAIGANGNPGLVPLKPADADALGRASTAIEETLPAEQGPVYRLGASSRRPTALGARLVSGPEPVGRPVDLNRRSDGRQLNKRALRGRLSGRLL
ncbi:hypothetical protein GGQ08_000758 [Salinibacter ruber]|nr:hypothetical protein [Salinibacter ruber]MCS3652718.1 hypothetical protein [Salinibacter ruber]